MSHMTCDQVLGFLGSVYNSCSEVAQKIPRNVK